ncbi:hypothetical protein GQ44DRAFT_726375 [Phaeosphaeriaceae sp. PMI808]|nr:hypothetical protein GQ44DRAFT_726375 [Phaeosphaeriaceae sp. PMI808]
MTWMHEDLMDEDDERGTCKMQPDAVNDEQQPRLPSPKSFNSEPTPDVQNDGTNGGPRLADESAGCVLRSVRSSKVMKPSQSRSTVPDARSQKQDYRLFRSSETFNLIQAARHAHQVVMIRFWHPKTSNFRPDGLSVPLGGLLLAQRGQGCRNRRARWSLNGN